MSQENNKGNNPKQGQNQNNNKNNIPAQNPTPEVSVGATNFEKSMVPLITIQDSNGKPVSINLETFGQIQSMVYKQVSDSPGQEKTSSVPPNMQYKVEDYLEEPVVFFSMRTGFTDYGAKDARTGTYHLPPFIRDDEQPNANGEYNTNRRQPIEFKFSHVGEVLEGRNLIKIKYCTYYCRNKKILEYLLNHPLLGIEFFRVTDKITTADGIRARALADANRDVLGMTNDIVLERLTGMSAQISQDMQENKNRLTSLLADQRMKSEETLLRNQVELIGTTADGARKNVFDKNSKQYDEVSRIAEREENFARTI